MARGSVRRENTCTRWVKAGKIQCRGRVRRARSGPRLGCRAPRPAPGVPDSRPDIGARGQKSFLMIICNSNRYVYIHLHKCAGTSVERALAKSLQYNDILIGSTDRGEALQPLFQQMIGLHKHSPAAAVLRLVGEDLWRSYFTFATVRNPFDLAISQYRFSLMLLEKALRQAGGALPDRAGPIEVPMSPRDWRWDYPGVRALVSADGMQTSFSAFIRSQYLENWGGFAPMSEHLSDDSGRLLVDEVFKLEELSVSWPDLVARLGVEQDIDLETYNATKFGVASATAGRGKGRRQHYRNADDISLIRARFRRDFELFGYAPRLEG